MSAYPEQLRQRFKEDFNLIIESKGIDEDTLMSRAVFLIPHVARKMGKKEDDLKKCLTKLGLIKGPVINGYVDTADNWKTFQIYVSWGLMIFVFKMIKLFLSRMSVRDDNRIVDASRISDEEMVSAARRLMQAFWEDTLWQTPSFAVIDLTKSQIELAAYLLHYAECFVIGHEFGHAIIESCPEKVGKELYIASGATESRNRAFLESLKLNEEEKIRALEKWPEELTADLLGLQLCLEQRDDNIGRMVIRSSAELFFISMLMLESFYEKTTGQNYWSYMYQCERIVDHPPTELRLEFLHSFVDRSSPSGAVELAIAFKQYSDYILSKV